MANYTYEQCLWLKDKGFPQERVAFGYYKCAAGDAVHLHKDDWNLNEYDGDFLCAAPTAQELLIWLMGTYRTRQKLIFGRFVQIMRDNGYDFPLAVFALAEKMKTE